MTDAEYSKMIRDAIEKDEVVNLLRGEGEYYVSVPPFESATITLDTNWILVRCFLTQKGKIPDIEKIFYRALLELLAGTANDVYLAANYFYDCIYYEEDRKKTFLIERERVAELLQDAIERNWAELKYGEKFFDMQIIYAWNGNCQEKYGLSIAPDLAKMARRTHFDSNETTRYYESLIKRAVENNEVPDLLRGEGGYKFRITQYSLEELIRETTTILVCCFFMQMGRIDGIDTMFYEILKELYCGDVKDVFFATLYNDAHSYYRRKEATFYFSYKELSEIIREAYIRYEQKIEEDGIAFGDGVKIKMPCSRVWALESELMKECAFQFQCHYVPEEET